MNACAVQSRLSKECKRTCRRGRQEGNARTTEGTGSRAAPVCTATLAWTSMGARTGTRATPWPRPTDGKVFERQRRMQPMWRNEQTKRGLSRGFPRPWKRGGVGVSPPPPRVFNCARHMVLLYSTRSNPAVVSWTRGKQRAGEALGIVARCSECFHPLLSEARGSKLKERTIADPESSTTAMHDISCLQKPHQNTASRNAVSMRL